MLPYHLADDFTDVALEQTLLASMAHTPALYWELLETLHPDVFAHETLTWHAMRQALASEQLPALPADWTPAAHPHAAARRVIDLYHRRLLATVQERLAHALFTDETAPLDLVALLEAESLQLQTTLQRTVSSPLQWASDLGRRCWLMPSPAASSAKLPAPPSSASPPA